LAGLEAPAKAPARTCTTKCIKMAAPLILYTFFTMTLPRNSTTGCLN